MKLKRMWMQLAPLPASFFVLLAGCNVIVPDPRGEETASRQQLAELGTELDQFGQNVVAAVVPENQMIGPTTLDCSDTSQGVALLSGMWRGPLTAANGTEAAQLLLEFDSAGNLVNLIRNNNGTPQFDTSFDDLETDTFIGANTDLIIRPLSSLVQCIDTDTRSFLIDSTILCDVDTPSGEETERTRLIQRLTLVVNADEEITMLTGVATTVNDIIASATADPGTSTANDFVTLTKQ
jgi:hypothetical protein